MVHIEITQDGKSLLSENFNESQVRMGTRRGVTALFKNGEAKTYELAPSRISQTIIVIEKEQDPGIASHGKDLQVQTMDRDDIVIISQMPTLDGELKCENEHHCEWHKKYSKNNLLSQNETK